jgi:hypothetical protein
MHVKYLLFFSDFNKSSVSLADLEKYSNINFIKIHPVGAEMFHVDRRMERQTCQRW